MKKKTYVLALALALGPSLSSLRAVAQTDSTSAAVDSELHAKVQKHLEHLNDELKLTEDQRQKIEPLLQSEFQQLKSVRSDSSLSADRKQAKAEEIRENAKKQIAPVLTPDQQAKFAEMKEQAKDH